MNANTLTPIQISRINQDSLEKPELDIDPQELEALTLVDVAPELKSKLDRSRSKIFEDGGGWLLELGIEAKRKFSKEELKIGGLSFIDFSKENKVQPQVLEEKLEESSESTFDEFKNRVDGISIFKKMGEGLFGFFKDLIFETISSVRKEAIFKKEVPEGPEETKKRQEKIKKDRNKQKFYSDLASLSRPSETSMGKSIEMQAEYIARKTKYNLNYKGVIDEKTGQVRVDVLAFLEKAESEENKKTKEFVKAKTAQETGPKSRLDTVNSLEHADGQSGIMGANAGVG